MLPITGTGFQLFGIGFDKWMHVALFGGLAVLLRWNLAAHRQALIVSVGAAFVIAAVAEVAQGLVAYRSAEWWDLIAGLTGAFLGAVSADRVLSSETLQNWLGAVVAILGFMMGLFFLLADIIGVGKSAELGVLQIAGMTGGALIALGGAQLNAVIRRAPDHRH